MPETDLATMLATLTVSRREGEFVFVTGADDAVGEAHASIREDEGTTFVFDRQTADAASLAYEFVGAWLTLNVFSSLEAVGLTAAVSTALANRGIPANVIAGYHHDHIIVPIGQAEQAMGCLADLRRDSVTE